MKNLHSLSIIVTTRISSICCSSSWQGEDPAAVSFGSQPNGRRQTERDNENPVMLR